MTALGVDALVVLYRPDPDLVRDQLTAVAPQVDRVLYVDNGGGRAALAGLGALGDPNIAVLGSGDNVGLARALNLGLADIAGRAGTEFALLLDQDSIPDTELVATLRRCFGAYAPRGRPVAAIGPAIVDTLRGVPEYFTRLHVLANTRIRSEADAGAEAFEVDFLITSGSLVHLPALDVVGDMDERLFIDSVDFDWSFRAVHRGYALLATFAATLAHRRGDEMVTRAGLPAIRVHSATRLFYMHRNRVWLYRRAYVPLAWKVHDVGRMLAKLLLLALVVPGRRRNLAAVARGLRAGVAGDGHE